MGEVVAMTGDGVNDAPAIKLAPVGVVVNEASEVSKEVADIILLDSNLRTIVKSVAEGRTIHANIKKVTLYLLSDSMSELILIMSSLVLKLPLAVTAAQILWINLIEDSLPALTLSQEPAERDVMKMKPRRPDARILDKPMLKVMLFFVLITDLALVSIYVYVINNGLDLAMTRTLIFAVLGIDSMIFIFSCKTYTKSIFRYNPFSNKYLNVSVLFGLVLLVASIYVPFLNIILQTVPLYPELWLVIFSAGLFNLVTIETLKAIFICGKYDQYV